MKLDVILESALDEIPIAEAALNDGK